MADFDVSGKSCPAYWCGTEKKNNLWLNDFKNKLLVETTTLPSYCFTSDSQIDEYRKIGQIHSNNFTGISILDKCCGPLYTVCSAILISFVCDQISSTFG